MGIKNSKMKLINENSPLKCLPVELGKKSILIFDSLRFTCEIIDHCYGQLTEELLKLSTNITEKKAPQILGYAWSIIDNSKRLVSLCEQLPWENKSEIVGHLFYVNEFRNTFQHLDERIEESLLKTDTPFYGIISWFYKYQNSKKVDLLYLISGNVISANSELTVPNLENSNSELNHILLHTVNRKGEQIKTDIFEIMNNLKKLVSELEGRLEAHCSQFNLNLCNWGNRQDVLIRLQQETND